MSPVLLPARYHHRLTDRLRVGEPVGVGASSLLRLESHERQFWVSDDRILGIRNRLSLYPLGVWEPSAFPQSFWNQIRGKRISISGLPEWLAPWEQALGPPWHAMNYHFMVHDSLGPAGAQGLPTLPEGVEIRQADPDDFERLWPLQRAYELEEVVFDPAEFREDIHQVLFRISLRRERHWYLSWRGIPLSKVSTNARGLDWVQLGGVYTVSEWRRRNLARTLLGWVLRILWGSSQKACLFVKRTNTAALGLYHRLGFRPWSDFRIVYYALGER